MGNPEKLMNQIFDLKFTSKSLQRQARKCEKEEKEQKLKVKKAIEKGNVDGARIYAENAIRKRTEHMNYLRLASCLDAVVARLDTQAKMQVIGKSMQNMMCCGQDAFDYFKNEPKFFDVYHAGYQEQMSHWPEQPVNIIINWLKSHNASWTIADFGCGNAAVAKNMKNKVFSIDLVSNDPSVIACDMAHTPLEPSSVDVAIFCLSLMGTNYPSYLQEANRVLKPSGWLVIAEVRSRLDPNTGGADPDKFSEAISQLGFSLVSKVGLLGMARSFQKELDQIAEKADTSTPTGLSYVLTETTLALLRHPDCCISAYSSV